MVYKCPPGIICIENMTIVVIILIIICGIIFYMVCLDKYKDNKENNNNKNINSSKETNINITQTNDSNHGYNDMFFPPIKPLQYMPVLVPSYKQYGIITPLIGSSDKKILPLMGLPIRHKYQYYTISNQHNNVKLPIIVNKKNGLNEYGVDELNTGDIVFVEGYNESYKVTIYDNSAINYF